MGTANAKYGQMWEKHDKGLVLEITGGPAKVDAYLRREMRGEVRKKVNINAGGIEPKGGKERNVLCLLGNLDDGRNEN